MSSTTTTTRWRSSSTRRHNAGLQVGVHAIGDRAIEQVLATWERVYLALDSRERRHFRARRHRIEHFVLPSARSDRANGDARTRRLGPARLRPALGAGRRACTRSGSDPHARWPRTRSARCSIGGSRSASAPTHRSTPLDPMLAIAALEEPPRADAATDEAGGAQAPSGGERSAGASGGEEGSARAGAARGLRRLRRRPARRAFRRRGSARSSRSPSAARSSEPDRGSAVVSLSLFLLPSGCPPVPPSLTSWLASPPRRRRKRSPRG